MLKLHIYGEAYKYRGVAFSVGFLVWPYVSWNVVSSRKTSNRHERASARFSSPVPRIVAGRSGGPDFSFVRSTFGFAIALTYVA